MKDKYDVVIIDSGVNIDHPFFKDKNIMIDEVEFHYNENGIYKYKTNSCNDRIGHGTAVTSIIVENMQNISVLMIKAFFAEMYIDEDALIDILNWINSSIDTKILHMSCGICGCTRKKDLYSICNQIKEKGTIIVAAFDNYGGISYPAAFDNVIGVDLSQRCITKKQMIYIEDSIINIRAFGVSQKVPWIGDSYQIVASSSFAAPHVTAMILSFLTDNMKFENVLEELRKRSMKVISAQRNPSISTIFPIKRAIALPFNKEIQCLARYSSRVSNKNTIVGYFDNPFSLQKNVQVWNEIKQNLGNGPVHDLKSWRNINWEDEFESVILGHIQHLSDIVQKDFLRYFLEQCLRYRKNVISFDPIDQYPDIIEKMHEKGVKFYHPSSRKKYCNDNWLKKLNELSVPLLCVSGTSKRQGKFSLQMEIKLELEKRGYKVGHLGTEPTAELLGADYCFPMGYNSDVSDDASTIISNVRYLLSKIEDKNVDIIITGTQSQTIPMVYNNIMSLPYYNYLYLLGAIPDLFLLVVNYDDEIEYIQKTIQFCESISYGEVAAIILSPISNEGRWSVVGSDVKILGPDVLAEAKVKLEHEIDKSIFLFSEVSAITEYILNQFQ